MSPRAAAAALGRSDPALRRRDWIGTGEGLGSAAALWLVRVSVVSVLCLRPPFPPDEVYRCVGPQGLPVH